MTDKRPRSWLIADTVRTRALDRISIREKLLSEVPIRHTIPKGVIWNTVTRCTDILVTDQDGDIGLRMSDYLPNFLKTRQVWNFQVNSVGRFRHTMTGSQCYVVMTKEAGRSGEDSSSITNVDANFASRVASIEDHDTMITGR